MFFSLMMDGSFTNEQAIKALSVYLRDDTKMTKFMKTPEGVFFSNCYFLESSILPEINDFMGERIDIMLPVAFPTKLTMLLRMCKLAFNDELAEILGDLFTIGLFKMFKADLPGIDETQAEYYRLGRAGTPDVNSVRNSEDTRSALKSAIPALFLSNNFKDTDDPDFVMMPFKVPRALGVYEDIVRTLITEQRDQSVARSTSLMASMCIMYGVDRGASDIKPIRDYYDTARARLVDMHATVKEMALKGGDAAAE